MPTELPHADLADFVTNVGEDRRDQGFQGLFLIATRLVLKQAFPRLGNELVTLGIGLLDHRVLLQRQFMTRSNIVYADGEPKVG